MYKDTKNDGNFWNWFFKNDLLNKQKETCCITKKETV